MSVYNGTVAWFNSSKGFGFLTRTDGKDVFVHYSAIEAQGYRTLEEGEEVEFEIVDGDQGPQAHRVFRKGKPSPLTYLAG